MQDIRVQFYKDINEFLTVSDLIVNGLNNDHRVALKYLKIWCERRPENKIPRSIFHTKCLLDVFLNQKSLMQKSLIIAKFVNSECKEEEDRNSYNHKIPLASTAKNIKLPAYMVELRHDIVHKDGIVGENRLDEAFTDSIEWLIDSFWKPQIQQISFMYISDNEITSILYEYKTLKAEGNFTWEHQYFSKISNIINSLSLNNFVNILLSENFMLCFNDDVFKNLLNIWKPMIQFLCERKQIHSIIENIFGKLLKNNSSSQFQITVREWCIYLLKACTLKQKNDNTPRLRIITDNVSMINWPSILLIFLKKSLCVENIQVLELLLKTHLPKLSEEKQVSIINIVKQYYANGTILSSDVILDNSVIQELQKSALCFEPFGM